MRGWTIPPANRVAKPFSRFVCVLAVAACGALAGPAIARAAGSPPGLGEADAQVQSALAQVDAVAPGAGAAVRPAVNQALAMAAAATAAVPQPPAPAPQPDPAPATPPAQTVPPAAPPASAPTTTPAQIVSDAVAPVMASIGVSAPPLVTAAPAGVPPPVPLPPAPPGPSQDLTAPAQAGGLGQLAPLLVAALAAALAFTRFPFRTRLLPRLAFRKPRRVVLSVWHPG
jgi:hypothetical protein